MSTEIQRLVGNFNVMFCVSCAGFVQLVPAHVGAKLILGQPVHLVHLQLPHSIMTEDLE